MTAVFGFPANPISELCVRLVLRWEYLCGERAQGLHVLVACSHCSRVYVLHVNMALPSAPSIRPWIRITYEAMLLASVL